MTGQSRSEVAQTQSCTHSVDIDACLYCAEFAAKRVWLSDSEAFFHNRFDCDARTPSESRGLYSTDPSWRRQIEFARAERDGARPCPVCRPYDPRRWKRAQRTERHVGELRLTHFTTISSLIGIVREREIVPRSRLDQLPNDVSSESTISDRRRRVLPDSDGTVADCVTFCLTHRPSFIDAMREGRADTRLKPVAERPKLEEFLALETTFRRITHRRSDEARSFELQWAVSSRDAADPDAGIRRSTADLIKLIDFAREHSAGRFGEHPIAKNAEFLVEDGVPFRLISRILVPSLAIQKAVAHLVGAIPDGPDIRIRSHWFESATEI